MSSFIHLENIKKVYNGADGTVFALDGIDLDIDEGESVAIIGKSGSGKSTLMNILGFLDTPSEGIYTLDGEKTNTENTRILSEYRRKNIGFIFQNYNLIPTLSAYENVELPLIYRRIPASERKLKTEEALYKVGLSDRMKHKPYELSGGQQQRVAIARAIAVEPRIILADEPSGNLDPESSEMVISMLRSLSPEKTVIMITHDITAANRMGRKIGITKGKIEKKY